MRPIVLLGFALIALNIVIWTRFFFLRAWDRQIRADNEKDHLVIKELKEQADRSYLYGLWMKPRFFSEAQKTLTDGAKGVTGLVAFDGDHFSSIFKKYGPVVSDEAALGVVRILCEIFPESEDNLLCAVSNKSDEFILLLRNRPSRESLIQELERFRVRVHECDEYLAPLPIWISVSIGVTFAEGQPDAKQLYEDACKALGQAKEDGGDCIRTYQSPDVQEVEGV